jgi:hypothetical protein
MKQEKISEMFVSNSTLPEKILAHVKTFFEQPVLIHEIASV